jgi:hypothetical protein
MIIKKLVYHGYIQNGNPISIYDTNGTFSTDHFYSAMPLLILILGLIFIAFTKEKIEDEQIAQLRLDSLQWSIYFSYSVFILSIAFVSAADFAHNIQLSLFIPLLFFVIRFRWKIFQLNSLLTKHEKSIYKS